MTDDRQPKFCPFCGGSKLYFYVAEWQSFSIEDTMNTAKLVEHQCADCGSASFWT